MTDVNVNTVSAVTKDCHSSISKLGDDLHILKMAIQRILKKELGMKCICPIWVPHFLQAEEMEHHRSVCFENLAQRSQDADFLSCVINVDESCIHHYNLKMKHASETWLHSGNSRMKKLCHQKSADKVMLVTFFNCRRIAYQHICPPKT